MLFSQQALVSVCPVCTGYYGNHWTQQEKTGKGLFGLLPFNITAKKKNLICQSTFLCLPAGDLQRKPPTQFYKNSDKTFQNKSSSKNVNFSLLFLIFRLRLLEKSELSVHQNQSKQIQCCARWYLACQILLF